MKIAHIGQAKLRKRANQSKIPSHFIAGLERYLAFGIHPGGFMRAILSNDLVDVINRADADALSCLRPLSLLVFDCIDTRAWGTRQRVDEWMEHQGYAGITGRTFPDITDG